MKIFLAQNKFWLNRIFFGTFQKNQKGLLVIGNAIKVELKQELVHKKFE